MRKIIAILIIVLILAGLFALSFLLSNSKGNTKQLYHCPMHPDYISNKPGDCPICGMKLVPIEKEEENENTSMNVHNMHNHKENSEKMEMAEENNINMVLDRVKIKISPQKQQLIGVKTDEVIKRELGKIVLANGIVAYDPELYYAEQQYISVLNKLKKEDNSNLNEAIESAKTRLKLIGLSEEYIREISKLNEPDNSLIISDLERGVWIYAQVYQDDIKYVKTGDEAQITSSSFSGENLYGKVIAIDPSLNPETRSIKVRIFVSNPKKLLKPEMYVNVEIKSKQGIFLSISEDAIIDTGTKQLVFVDKGNGYFEPRYVTLSGKIENFYIIKSGLTEGEKVVTSANFLIDSESQLKAAISSMSGHKH